jgi:hypothetical protein
LNQNLVYLLTGFSPNTWRACLGNHRRGTNQTRNLESFNPKTQEKTVFNPSSMSLDHWPSIHRFYCSSPTPLPPPLTTVSFPTTIGPQPPMNAIAAKGTRCLSNALSPRWVSTIVRLLDALPLASPCSSHCEIYTASPPSPPGATLLLTPQAW